MSQQRYVNFEVFGKVQGVFFRKYTKEKADSLGIRGWVYNHDSGTVQGYAEGSTDAMNKFLTWLEKTGSPKSKIEKLTVQDTTAPSISSSSLKSFDIKK